MLTVIPRKKSYKTLLAAVALSFTLGSAYLGYNSLEPSQAELVRLGVQISQKTHTGPALSLTAQFLLQPEEGPKVKNIGVLYNPAAKKSMPVLVFHAGFEPQTVDALINLLREVKKAGHSDVLIDINSPGGYVFTLVGLLKEIKVLGLTVHTRTGDEAMAASCGAVLFSQGKTRILATTGTVMFHETAMGGSSERTAPRYLRLAEEIRKEEVRKDILEVLTAPDTLPENSPVLVRLGLIFGDLRPRILVMLKTGETFAGIEAMFRVQAAEASAIDTEMDEFMVAHGVDPKFVKSMHEPKNVDGIFLRGDAAKKVGVATHVE